MTHFGAIHPIVSVVLSTFMLGLGLGSFLALKIPFKKLNLTPWRTYLLAEGFIGVGAFVVVPLFKTAAGWINSAGEINSFSYLFASSVWIVIILLPFTFSMGLTIPLALESLSAQARVRAFGRLYAANLLGAFLGCSSTVLIFIESLGFSSTLALAGAANFLIAFTGLLLNGDTNGTTRTLGANSFPSFRSLGPVFLSGFVAMALEVLWLRQLTGRLGNSVYSFSLITGTYLVFSFLGVLLERFVPQKVSLAQLWGLVPACIAFSFFTIEPSPDHLILFAIFAIAPISLLFGVFLPRAVHEVSGSVPALVGGAYFINAIGCAVGPLFMTYILLAHFGQALAITTLLVFSFVAYCFSLTALRKDWIFSAALCVFVGFVGLLANKSFQPKLDPPVLRSHDSVAEVIASGQGMNKRLLVNNVGITHLTTITKAMVHLPAALLEKSPENILVICFGMGTSFASAMSWESKTTVVELVPSVVEFFSFFHPQKASLMQDPKATIIVDDGRRFLDRTRDTFDVISIDPPPPFDSAYSGMLYSVEFYQRAAKRLSGHGILQQWWYHEGDPYLLTSVLKAIQAVFPHVVIMPSMEGWGLHILASAKPISAPSAATAIERMPPGAKLDFVEWTGMGSLESIWARMLRSAYRLEPNSLNYAAPPITDDLPVNEYGWLRSFRR